MTPRSDRARRGRGCALTRRLVRVRARVHFNSYSNVNPNPNPNSSHNPNQVRSHAVRGYSCFASDVDLQTNLEAFARRAAAPAAGSAAAGTPLALFASVEDAALLRGPSLRGFNLSSLASLGAVVSAARREHGLTLPDGIAAGPNSSPGQCPSSAPASPRRAPGGSGQLSTPSARGRATGRSANASGARSSHSAASPSHRLRRLWLRRNRHGTPRPAHLRTRAVAAAQRVLDVLTAHHGPRGHAAP